MLARGRVLTNFEREQERLCTEIDSLLDALLPIPADNGAPLIEAMRYASIGGGKRFRPLLVSASAELFDVPPERVFRTGLAVECIHAQSLIHDDLPCMDDDDLRRGKPTTHRKYGEATAILAGDALLALAFEVLADPATHPNPDIRTELIRTLAAASGAAGMARGQTIDLLTSGLDLDIEEIEHLQRLKTGAMIGWSVAAGAILGRASSTARRHLDNYARCLGLAFQIADDLLDIEGNEAALGKRVGKDGGAGKGTLVSALGIEGARDRGETLARAARGHLAPFGVRADFLCSIAELAMTRDC